MRRLTRRSVPDRCGRRPRRRRRPAGRALRPRPEARRHHAHHPHRGPEGPRPHLDHGLRHARPRLPVYDTLFASDASLQIKPQMVDKYTVSRDRMKWTFTLRDGLKFHDGQPVTAEDCVVSLQRWGKKDSLGKLLLAATGRLAASDRKTFALDLKEPFGAVLDALGKPSSNVPFIMPARLAATDANEQIKEVDRLGPYRFVKAEWQPGNQVVYERNADYVPRNEAPSGAAGGKRVNVDRVIARYIPDAATASAALEAGEVDWWDNPPVDFVDASREEPEHHRVREESRREPGLAAAQPPVPAVQQQEGASGAAPHGRPGDVPAGGGRQREVLPHVPELLHVRRLPYGDGGRRAGQARRRARPAAHEGERLRRQADRAARRRRQPEPARLGARHARAPVEDRRRTSTSRRRTGRA